MGVRVVTFEWFNQVPQQIVFSICQERAFKKNVSITKVNSSTVTTLNHSITAESPVVQGAGLFFYLKCTCSYSQLFSNFFACHRRKSVLLLILIAASYVSVRPQYRGPRSRKLTIHQRLLVKCAKKPGIYLLRHRKAKMCSLISGNNALMNSLFAGNQLNWKRVYHSTKIN